MEFLYLLEKIRTPWLNEFMLAITQLGEETAFLVLALIFFWCVDKKKGYYIMAVGFTGTMLNHFLKLTFRIPRPWILDTDFTIVEEARAAASGYSFPSGHTQSAVATFGSIACIAKKKQLALSCIAVAALVGFSRMYLGVHTPKDVLVGAAVAISLILLLKPFILGERKNGMKILIGSMLLLSVCQLFYVEMFPFPTDMDQENIASGLKNAYTMIGCITGVAVVYILDTKYLPFAVDAVWWVQILKSALGLAIVLIVKSGLKAPLETLFSGHLAARALRYFFIVLTAGFLWPMTFRWFARLGKHNLQE